MEAGGGACGRSQGVAVALPSAWRFRAKRVLVPHAALEVVADGPFGRVAWWSVYAAPGGALGLARGLRRGVRRRRADGHDGAAARGGVCYGC